jgi:hypothetical protein
MKKSRFTDSQIMEALKRAEAGIKVPDLCRELGVSSALFYRWRAKYGGLNAFTVTLRLQHSQYRWHVKPYCPQRCAYPASAILRDRRATSKKRRYANQQIYSD